MKITELEKRTNEEGIYLEKLTLPKGSVIQSIKFNQGRDGKTIIEFRGRIKLLKEDLIELIIGEYGFSNLEIKGTKEPSIVD